jgi:hypothetical protein
MRAAAATFENLQSPQKLLKSCIGVGVRVSPMIFIKTGAGGLTNISVLKNQVL